VTSEKNLEDECDMECQEAKELLSEYMDGLLDGARRALIEEHLNACSGCRDELSSLKTLVKELGSLDTVPVPENFLKQIHEQLERSSRLSRILHTLFVPFRIKVPLQFAGAAVVALLLSFVFLLETPVVYHTAKTQDEQGERPDRGPQPFREETLSQDESFQPAFSEAESRIGVKKQQKAPIELALLIKETSKEEASQRLTFVDAPGLQKKARKKVSRAKAGTAEGLPGRTAPADSEADSLPEPAPPAAPRETQGLSPGGGSAFPLEKVAEIIGLAGGEIIEVHDATEGTGSPSILLALPGLQYPELLEELGTMGTLQNPDYPPQDLTGDLQVRLRLLFPE
jgi:hypothetical protein